MKYVIVVIALLLGGWLTFDGARALTVGDYVTARTGSNAGQLGPWSRVVSAFGIDPRGKPMKFFHVVLGCGWLISMTVFLLRPALGWWCLCAASVLSLWYLPFGTLLGIIELWLLLLPQIRNLR